MAHDAAVDEAELAEQNKYGVNATYWARESTLCVCVCAGGAVCGGVSVLADVCICVRAVVCCSACCYPNSKRRKGVNHLLFCVAN